MRYKRGALFVALLARPDVRRHDQFAGPPNLSDACGSLGMEVNIICANCNSYQDEEQPDRRRSHGRQGDRAGSKCPNMWVATAIAELTASRSAIEYHRLREKFNKVIDSYLDKGV